MQDMVIQERQIRLTFLTPARVMVIQLILQYTDDHEPYFDQYLQAPSWRVTRALSVDTEQRLFFIIENAYSLGTRQN